MIHFLSCQLGFESKPDYHVTGLQPFLTFPEAEKLYFLPKVNCELLVIQNKHKILSKSSKIIK